MNPTRRLIIAITGASGAVYGVRMLERLKTIPHIETHLIVSAAGWLNINHELAHLGYTRERIESYAHITHHHRNIGASIASGSFRSDGMIIAPCSMKTLAAIAHGFADNLISRTADVMLKERRRLVLMPRETPLNLVHLRNMTTITEMGGIIFPPLPAFYHQPQSIEAMVDHTIERILSLFDVELEQPAQEWLGLNTHHTTRDI
jgi:flavin prenyltransferase